MNKVDGGILLQTLLYGGNPVLFAKIGFEDACLDGVARLQLGRRAPAGRSSRRAARIRL
ncbi:hypothetical protein LNQ52_29475 [Klebsiella pneumoniae subsp. pneumoniae]|nr:hypothetical protein [Klebsiella pneumoniae subsp. pneumoniae]